MTSLRLMLGGLFLGAALTAMGQDKPQRPKDGPKRLDPGRLLEQFDKNKDGTLDKSEVPERMKDRFGQMDLNKDGKLSKEELSKAGGRGKQPPAGRGDSTDVLFRHLDANNDGKLTEDELKNAAKVLAKLDTNKDGAIDQGEIAPDRKKRGGRPGEVITPAAKGERHQDTLKVGDMAPDFTLPDPDGKKQVALSSFRGKKPVVLVFASYT